MKRPSKKETKRSLDWTIANTVRSTRAYLSAGGDIESRDRDGRTLLINAASMKRPKVVKLLLERGADVNARDDGGRCALHFAALEYAVEVAELLLAGGAAVDLKDADGNTALSTAVFCSEGRGEMITLLLRAGAKPRARNKHGVSPLGLAKELATFDALQYFA